MKVASDVLSLVSDIVTAGTAMKRLSNSIRPLLMAFWLVSANTANSASSAVKHKKPSKQTPPQIVSLSVTPGRAHLQRHYGDVRILVDGKTSAGTLTDASAKATSKLSDPAIPMLDENGIFHIKPDG